MPCLLLYANALAWIPLRLGEPGTGDVHCCSAPSPVGVISDGFRTKPPDPLNSAK